MFITNIINNRNHNDNVSYIGYIYYQLRSNDAIIIDENVLQVTSLLKQEAVIKRK